MSSEKHKATLWRHLVSDYKLTLSLLQKRIRQLCLWICQPHVNTG